MSDSELILLIICFLASVELTIGRVGLGWAGPTVGWAKTGSGQNWPGFFGQKF